MSRSKNRRSLRRKVNTGLNFSRLEPRKMLAGDIPAEANLIVNGDFETFTNQDSSNRVNEFATARFYGSDLVPGWTVTDGDGDDTQRINLLTFNNDRGTVFDVDSTSGQDDRVFQDVDVSVGQQYLFSFDFYAPNQVAGVSQPPSNDFEVYYNGDLLGTPEGTNRYRQATFVVTGAANDSAGSTEAGDLVSARFEFRDGSSGDRGGDGRGSLIDAVSLVPIAERAVINGEFENNSSTNGPNFAPEDVNGFSLFRFTDDTEDRVIQILPDDGDAGSFLNLNSSPDLIDQVFQDLSTEAGETYFVSFDVRVDPTSTLEPDQLRVRFDNQYAATVVGNDQWQRHSILVEASSSSSRLTFREPGEDPGDGASPQIDNVQYFQVGAVTPTVNDPVVDTSEPGDSNFFFSFDENSRVPTTTVDADTTDTGSVFIFADAASDFNYLDVDFTNSDSSVISFTGGTTFNADGKFFQFDVTDPNNRFAGLTATDGRLFGVSVLSDGIDPANSDTDADFRTGADGFLLAQLDFDIVGEGTANLDFILGGLGVFNDSVEGAVEVAVGFESGAVTVSG